MPKALFIPDHAYIESLRNEVGDSEERVQRLRDRLQHMEIQELPALLARSSEIQETLRQRRSGNDEAKLVSERQTIKTMIAQLISKRRQYEQRLALCVSALDALSLELAITEENSTIRGWVGVSGA